MTRPDSTFVYVTFIRTTADKLWAALTDPAFVERYWLGVTLKTDWTAGSPWQISFPDGRVADAGEILECDPQHRIVIKWQNEFKPEFKAEGFARCVIELEPVGAAMKLTVTHSMERDNSLYIKAVSGGWPRILSNLKSLLETGEIALLD